jgi:hypothetical protein
MRLEGLLFSSIFVGGLMSVVGCSDATPASPTRVEAMLPADTTPMQSHERPFEGKVTGEASFDMTNPRGCAAGFTTITNATGTGTHLGATRFRSEHCVNETGQIAGSVVLTAANGDQLFGTYTGSTTAPGAIGDSIHARAEIVFAGGTGRFADASGTAELTATVVFEGFSDLSWPGRWEWKGSLKY